MSKHTEAPWHPVECSGYSGIATEDNLVFASCYARVGIETMKANARLMAAAPNLLIAAKEVIDNWEQGHLAVAVRKLQAAINLAEEV